MTERQYAAAGVDLEIAEASKARIARLVASTRTPLAAGAIGSFGGMVRVPTGYRKPLLVMSTDGVGTKVLVARDAGRPDTVGVHDLTLTPCSQATFDLLYPEFAGAPHPSCFANLCAALAPFGVDPDRVGTTLNVFMDVWTDDRGELHIDPPPTRPGDRFTIEARMPVVVGVTACSAEKSNNGHCTPIDWRVEIAVDRG